MFCFGFTSLRLGFVALSSVVFWVCCITLRLDLIHLTLDLLRCVDSIRFGFVAFRFVLPSLRCVCSSVRYVPFRFGVRFVSDSSRPVLLDMR